MVRLVFRPYTQVRRTICTSVSLRASTRVSSGFASLRHSSPSFGSRHACSNSNPSQKIGVGRRCNPREFPPVSFLVPSGFPHPSTPHACQTPWSVFQDGSDGEPTGPHPLPSRQFQALFDSLFKVLFIFPSRYLFAIGLSPIFSLGRNLPPDWGCIPKQPDSSTAPRGATGSEPDGALTLPGAPFQGTWARSVAEDASPDYNSDDAAARFSSWADPGSLAVTKGILVSFFSSAYLYA
ncbi:unnamed protein product [Musa acuminata var. zebrina]